MGKRDIAPPGVDRRAHIEDLLASYPNLEPGQLEELVHWFSREASALDVGMIASDEALKPGYERSKAEHLDRFTLKDIAFALAFAAVVVGVIAFLGLWSSWTPRGDTLVLAAAHEARPAAGRHAFVSRSRKGLADRPPVTEAAS